MDRDDFPQLLQNESGWPVLQVNWGGGGDSVRVTVWEDEVAGCTPVIDIRVPPPVKGCKQAVVRLNGEVIHDG